MPQPVLLIHGGAGSRALSPQRRREVTESLQRILASVYPKLLRGMSALDAAIAASVLLEDDPLYNAGKGSKLQSDGKIRMSASLMDGFRRKFSGAVNVEGVKNPVLLAKALLKREDRVLSGPGARRFAREIGLEFASNYTPKCRADFANQKHGKSGTIGAVALDRKGRLAAATSTGGRGFEYPYRVSDSPTVAGNFANTKAAVSATGTGEEIVEHAVASTICAWAEAGMPLSSASRRMLTAAKKSKAEFGFIALDARGNFEALTSTELLIWAAADKSGLHLLGR